MGQGCGSQCVGFGVCVFAVPGIELGPCRSEASAHPWSPPTRPSVPHTGTTGLHSLEPRMSPSLSVSPPLTSAHMPVPPPQFPGLVSWQQWAPVGLHGPRPEAAEALQLEAPAHAPGTAAEPRSRADTAGAARTQALPWVACAPSFFLGVALTGAGRGPPTVSSRPALGQRPPWEHLGVLWSPKYARRGRTAPRARRRWER